MMSNRKDGAPGVGVVEDSELGWEGFKFIYGTAWKNEATESLVKMAIGAGFTAIDTANQKKHYREDLVGKALKELYDLGLKRESLFLQSKFTHVQGQDHRLPYDPNASYADQVESSFASTLQHLYTDYLDSFLLHGPSSREGMTDEDWEVWKAMESLYDLGKTRTIGLSNVSPVHLRQVLDFASVKPSFVQNRCFAVLGWDREVRRICQENEIIYQGFSLLTANQQILDNSEMLRLAKHYETSTSQIVFRFSQQVGMLPLTGTSSRRHMEDDLQCDRFTLTESEIQLIENIAG